MTPDDADDFEFDHPDDRRDDVRELEATVVRLQAQLDQLVAEYRTHRVELDALREQVRVLEQTLDELIARRKRRDGPLYFVWAIVWGAIGATLANLLLF